MNKESLEEILQDAIYVKNNVSNEHISRRYGCDAVKNKMKKRDNAILDTSNNYTVYYISTYPPKDSRIKDKNNKDIDNEFIIYRNAPIAVEMQQNNVGDNFSFTAVDTLYRHQTNAHIYSLLDYYENSIDIEDEDQRTFYQLEDFYEQLLVKRKEREENLRRQKELEEKRKRAEEEKLSAIEKKKITDEINKLKRERKILEGQIEEKLRITKYIRNQSQLRFKPNLDTEQYKIKCNNLYNGVTVVISGGPGTGKTTTMIARLKYLIDTIAIDADTKEDINKQKYQLTLQQRDELKGLIERDLDWVFFSPSQLLKEYLAKAMEGEGLRNPSRKTYEWNTFRAQLMREYGFFSVETDKSPFKKCREAGELIHHNSRSVELLTQFYLRQFYTLGAKLPKIDETKYKWKWLADIIKNRLMEMDGYSVEMIIHVFNMLNSNYFEECEKYNEELRNKINEVQEYIYAKLKTNEEKWKCICEFINGEEDDKNIILEEDIIDGQLEEELEDTIQETLISEEHKVYKLVQTWIRPYSLSLIYPEKPLSERQKAISSIIEQCVNEEDIVKLKDIGQLVLFSYFSKYTKGARRFFLKNIVSVYKNFRRKVLHDKNEGWDLDILKRIVDTGNKDLHYQEQSLLLGFVNNMVKTIKKLDSTNGSIKYAENLEPYIRPIIGIDEVADFSEIEIYSMISFSNSEYSSVTIAGDLMQRMTERGIKSWNDLDNVIKSKHVTQLNKSYRQSSKMLNVAKQLYHDTVGENAGYTTFLTESKVPSPLAIIDTNETVKIKWIAERISEIFKVYGCLPSIAIFLNDKNATATFAAELQDTDFFFDNDITVVDCSQGQTIGNTNQIRVFPIEYVKGMEFDVVFFHNIDNANLSDDLVKRYLYVGVSRAAFYLGATFVKDKPEISKYFVQNEKWG